MTPPSASMPPNDGPSTYAIVAGGGTAGHIQPALAIAGELVRRGVPVHAVHLLGSRRGLDPEQLPATGHPFTLLPGRGIQRRLTIQNVTAAWGIVRAIVSAVGLVRRLRPAVVVGVGGYASVPGVVAAVVTRTPLVIAEQNAVPSAANRLAGRFAAAAAVPFPDTDLPRAVVTGNPVRPGVLDVDRSAQRAAARERLGIEADRHLLAVVGGSLGARRINEATLVAASTWRDRDDLAIRLIGGARDHDDLARRAPVDDLDPLQYDLVEYEHDMPSVFAAADLVLSRAGGNTVAELAVVGVGAILVPLPGAPGDHQTANSRSLERAGAAVVVPDDELDGARVVAEVDRLLADPSRLEEMAAAAAGVGRRDAVGAIVDLVEIHAARPAPAPAAPMTDDSVPDESELDR